MTSNFVPKYHPRDLKSFAHIKTYVQIFMASLYSPQIETIQISINWRVEIPIVEYPYNKTLLLLLLLFSH